MMYMKRSRKPVLRLFVCLHSFGGVSQLLYRYMPRKNRSQNGYRMAA
jgi:hypothetical protein